MGRAGEASPTLRELGIFSSFSLFCSPDFSLPPEDVTAAASDSPPQAGQESLPQQVQGGIGLARGCGPKELTKPARTPPLPVSDSAGKFKRGKVFLSALVSPEAEKGVHMSISSLKES